MIFLHRGGRIRLKGAADIETDIERKRYIAEWACKTGVKYGIILEMSEENWHEILKNWEDIGWVFPRYDLPADDDAIKNFEQIRDSLTQYYRYIRQYPEKLILNIQD